MYKFVADDNLYNSYSYVETTTFQKCDDSLAFKYSDEPMRLRFFTNDTFNIDSNTNQAILYHSNTRQNQYLPGILDLTMTHGKVKNKFLYLCKPDDKRLPFFLIPYSIPYNFDKSIRKLYVTFEFNQWNDKLPHGRITQNLGSIMKPESYFEYLLYTKSLNVSIQKFTKDARHHLNQCSAETIIDEITKVNDIEVVPRKNEFIFTLDSSQAADFDDALSFCKHSNCVSVYITNVALVMESLNLWGSFTNRISSIYLPDKKRSMIPGILTEGLCSLREGQKRLCYCLKIYFDNDEKPVRHEIKLRQIVVSRNFAYERPSEFSEISDYKAICNRFGCNRPRELVTRVMLHFNHHVAKLLHNRRSGIFKCLKHDIMAPQKTHQVPQDIMKRIDVIQSGSSCYCLHDKAEYKSAMHMDIDVYIQCSSPMRRLVDILNNIALLAEYFPTIPNIKMGEFYRFWTSEEKLDYINVSSRSIRKIQSKCRIYDLYEKNRRDGADKVYVGYMFDRVRKEGAGKYQYTVLLPEINLTSNITLVEEYDNYSSNMFRIYVFLSEENEKKKIKLQLA